MFEKIVTTKNGVEKRVVAQNQEELDEAVKAVKAEQSAVAPDIHNPKDGNKIVSPDNAHTEPPFVQPADPDAPTEAEESSPKDKAKTKK